MGSFSEKRDDTLACKSIDTDQVDTGAQVVAGVSLPLDPEESLRIRRKIDKHLMPLMCILYLIQYMDKITLGSSAILGIQKATHLTTDQYNWLGTIFYLGYLVFEFPQNLALQKFPVGKWMTLNIFVWAIALCSHAACKNFAGLFAVRLILGACEGSITAGFMIVSSMFYTRREHTARVGYWYLMNGVAQIISGFISFGVLHTHSSGFEPWQWLMIIMGALTLVTSALFFFLFPDSPTNAWFLTIDERVKAVQRIQENQTGVENKHFKRDQYASFAQHNVSLLVLNRMIEALTDKKTWLFAIFIALASVQNSISNQFQIITSSFGFTPIKTTLLSCVNGVIIIIAIYSGVTIASRIPNSRAWVAIIYYIPNIFSVFLINFLPWHDRVLLMFSVWLSAMATTGSAIAIAWVSQTTAGHTKRITTNAIILIWSCIGNAAGPFMWKAKYKPRNHIPWMIFGICDVACMSLLFAVRVLLSRENKRRDAEPLDDTYDNVFLTKMDQDGNRAEVKVAKELLDLTDKQNRDFRYVL
ncbi:MFS general substrate transporter [Lactarius quietus]|nr:MFS general substrate transporter [Lactarius quietus]